MIIGQVLSGGVGQAPARQAMRGAGIPDSTPALTINKVCGSGLKAVMLGADSIRLGDAGVVIAGGMENMSLAPYFLKKARNGYRMGNGEIIDLMVYDGLTTLIPAGTWARSAKTVLPRMRQPRRTGRLCHPLL